MVFALVYNMPKRQCQQLISSQLPERKWYSKHNLLLSGKFHDTADNQNNQISNFISIGN